MSRADREALVRAALEAAAKLQDEEARLLAIAISQNTSSSATKNTLGRQRNDCMGRAQDIRALDPAAIAEGVTVQEAKHEQDCTLGVGDGTGQLFVHGSYEAVKVCQSKLLELERLRARVAEQAHQITVLRARVAEQEAKVESKVPSGPNPHSSYCGLCQGCQDEIRALRAELEDVKNHHKIAVDGWTLEAQMVKQLEDEAHELRARVAKLEAYAPR